MLSQQDLMELFIFGLNYPESICGTRDGPDDVCEWKRVKCNGDGEVERFRWIRGDQRGTLGFDFLPCSMTTVEMYTNALRGTIQLADLPAKMQVLSLYLNQLILPLTGFPLRVENWFSVKTNSPLTRRKDTSPWWVGPVPQFWGKPRTFLNPSSCFCHGADPIDGHRKVVGQDQYPALGEVRETAKLLPRGESPWWRDDGRHLLILCCFQSAG